VTCIGGRWWTYGNAEQRTHNPPQAGLALSGVVRVEIHNDEANAISAAIPRRLGYLLDRVVGGLPPEAPAHSGREQIWVMERPGPDGQD
jgi:hypothetical protein